MKLLIMMLMTMFGTMAYAGGGGAIGQHFVKTIYVSSAGKTANSGSSYDAAKPCQVGTGALASGTTVANLWAIPAQMNVEHAYMIIDTAVASVTAIDIGDDDTSNGLIKTGSLTLATPGLYGWGSDKAGSYLQATSNVASVPTSKFYSGSSGASNKTVKMTYTAGGCSAGKFRVILEGLYVGVKPTI